MTIIRCNNDDFNNTRMNATGYEIIAIERYGWSETEILWAKDNPIDERDLPPTGPGPNGPGLSTSSSRTYQ